MYISFQDLFSSRNPLFRVFKRIEYVVDVDDHTAVQGRQDLRDVMNNVAACFCHVRRVDKQDVVSFQHSEQLDINVLETLTQYLGSSNIVRSKQSVQPFDVRLDERQVRIQSWCGIQDVEHKSGRKTRSDLNYSLRPHC